MTVYHALLLFCFVVIAATFALVLSLPAPSYYLVGGGGGGAGTPLQVIRYKFEGDKMETKKLSHEELAAAVRKLLEENDARALVLIGKPHNHLHIEWIYINEGGALDMIRIAEKKMLELLAAPKALP